MKTKFKLFVDDKKIPAWIEWLFVVLFAVGFAFLLTYKI